MGPFPRYPPAPREDPRGSSAVPGAAPSPRSWFVWLCFYLFVFNELFFSPIIFQRPRLGWVALPQPRRCLVPLGGGTTPALHHPSLLGRRGAKQHHSKARIKDP